MDISTIIVKKREDIYSILQKYGGSNPRYLVPENGELDFIIDIKDDWSYFDLGGIQYRLQELFDNEVGVYIAKEMQERSDLAPYLQYARPV